MQFVRFYYNHFIILFIYFIFYLFHLSVRNRYVLGEVLKDIDTRLSSDNLQKAYKKVNVNCFLKDRRK